MVSDPFRWCPPCGDMGEPEREVVEDQQQSLEERMAALWCAAQQATVKRVGGGVGPTVSRFPTPEGVEEVCVPPALLDPPLLFTVSHVGTKIGSQGAQSHYWLGDPKQPHEMTPWFLYVIQDKAWVQGWRPQALPRWRCEVDASCDHHGLQGGLAWVDLAQVMETPGKPVRDSPMGLALFATDVFGKGRDHLLHLIRDAVALHPAREWTL